MSPLRWILWALGTLALGVALPAWLFAAGASDRPELEVRTIPWHTHAGRLLASSPLGQGFRCRFDGLRRIDVRAVPTDRKPPSGPFELVLRADAPDGDVVRHATFDATRDPIRGNWAGFEFEPVEDSGGRVFFFELTPGDGAAEHNCAVWVRWRGQIGEARPWGGEAVEGSAQARFRSALPDLSAVAVAMDALPAGAEAVLEVWPDGPQTTETPTLLRRSTVAGAEVRGGFVFFPFPPIAESYAVELRLEFTLPTGARAVLHEGELSFKAYHGAHEPQAELLGATSRGERLEDRDLFVRVYSSSDTGTATALLAERAGGGFVAAALAWLIGVGAALFVATARLRAAT